MGLSEERPEQATEVFFQLHDKMNDDTKKGDLIEKLTDALHNKNLFGEVVKFKSFLCDGVVSSRVVFGTVIHALTKTNQHNKAKDLFAMGLSQLIYKETYDVLNPLLM